MSDLASGIADFLSFDDGNGSARAIGEAAMAAAALVATARSGVTFAERALLDQALQALAGQDDAPCHAGSEMFQQFVDAISANSSQGRRDALFAIAECPPEGRDLVLKVATAMAHANGQPAPEQIAMTGEIAAAMGRGAQASGG